MTKTPRKRALPVDVSHSGNWVFAEVAVVWGLSARFQGTLKAADRRTVAFISIGQGMPKVKTNPPGSDQPRKVASDGRKASSNIAGTT
jgi:hypothetical protein